MKKYLSLCLLFFTIVSFGQVGSNTSTPRATLDIVSGSNVLYPNGIMVPRLSRASLIAKTAAYAANQAGAMIYITQIDGTVNSATSNILETGYYYFDGTRWQSFNSSTIIGEVKYVVLNTDFDGWVKLDGRAVSSLPANQRIAAESLGFTTTLPNLNNGYLSQTNATLGTELYANTKTISRANLPNASITTTAVGNHTHTVDFAATTTSTNGNHTHTNNSSGGFGQHGFGKRSPNHIVSPKTIQTTDTANSGTELDLVSTPTALTINNSGNHNHTIDISLTTSATDPAHSHTFELTNNVPQVGFDVRPATISTNMFVYLGQ